MKSRDLCKVLMEDERMDYKYDQSVKKDQGKNRLSLVPTGIIEAIGWVRTFGAEKYRDPDNWKLVEPHRYKDAMLRHLVKYLEEPTKKDEESGLPHLWHMACNLAFLIEMEDKE